MWRGRPRPQLNAPPKNHAELRSAWTGETPVPTQSRVLSRYEHPLVLPQLMHL